jgi:hypothetical protein
VRFFAVGFAMICVIYMVPLLGFVAWTTIGVLGLGGATLAFIAAYRRENPAAVPRAPSAAVTAPAAPDFHAGGLRPNPDAAGIAFEPSIVPPAPVVASDIASFPHAAFRDRLAAFVLDVILVVIARQLLDLTRRDSSLLLLLLAYHIAFWTWKGTTVGGIICRSGSYEWTGPGSGCRCAGTGLSIFYSRGGWAWRSVDSQGSRNEAWHDRSRYLCVSAGNWHK